MNGDMKNMEKRDYWLWASAICELYFEKLNQLIGLFGNIENLYNACEKDFAQKGVGKEWEDVIIRARNEFDINQYKKELSDKDIHIVTIEDKEYPDKLFSYHHKPYFLFYKGILPDMDKPSVAMVGARTCTNYGRNMARNLSRELSDRGVQIISGMARGIDTYSHLGALEGNTPTFAVLGCGVDYCYPTENIELYNAILEHGGILSEYPIGAKPLSWHFPWRNRIISGLSDIVIVAEAKEKSGSLITVEWALEQGKDIMAVPGRVGDRLSIGCNRLIKSGAGMVTCVEDILAELDYKPIADNSNKLPDKYINITDKELKTVYDSLNVMPQNIQTIIEACNLKYEVVTEKLLKLQLMGIIEQPIAGCYVRKF